MKPNKGKHFEFHGSYFDKAKAVEKASEVSGFIRERKIDGRIRYFILTDKKQGNGE